MTLEHLKLKNFRNYTELNLHLHHKLNLFIGLNAQGKSNLLEAISFCLTGESFRPGSANNFINLKSKLRTSQLQAKVKKRSVENLVDIHFIHEKKDFFIDNKKSSKEGLKKRFGLVIFSPDTISVVKSGPQERRELIDNVMSTIDRESSNLVYNYKKALLARNRVFKSFIEGKFGSSELNKILSGLDPIFLLAGAELTIARIKSIKSLLPSVKDHLQCILKESVVDISVEYVISDKSAIDWSQNQVYDSLKSRLNDLSKAEIRIGQSLIGPHKHDIRFLLDGQDARFFASQGQQRSIVLAFKLAQVARHYEVNGDYPVLLLDDVLSELDIEKRDGLLSLLKKSPAQVFITATELDENSIFKEEEKLIFKIEKGNVNTGWI